MSKVTWTPTGGSALVRLLVVIAAVWPLMSCASAQDAAVQEGIDPPPQPPDTSPPPEGVSPPDLVSPAPIVGVAARYAPFDEGAVPMPNDIWRDDLTGRLAVPVSPGAPPAEQAFRTFLNDLDGWSTAFAGTIDFTGRIDPSSVTEDSVQVWLWGDTPQRLEVLGRQVTRGDTRVVVDPPRFGWPRGAEIVMLARGGANGVRDADGSTVFAEPIFRMVASQQPVEIKFLEEVRLTLAPYFDWFERDAPEGQRVARGEMVALWRFTVTERVELAMDRASRRMPIPFDLLIDPDTQRIHIPASPWDTELEAAAKVQLNKLRGFGLSGDPIFELTGPIDASTATPEHVRLIDLASGDELEVASVSVLPRHAGIDCASEAHEECRHVAIRLAQSALPLQGGRRYAIEVLDGLRDLEGRPVLPMPIGHFVASPHPLSVAGISQISALTDEEARLLESVRQPIASAARPREGLVTAWPFTTLDVWPELESTIAEAETRGVSPAPSELIVTEIEGAADRRAAFEVLFPKTDAIAGLARWLYAPRLKGVGLVVETTVETPNLMDPVTRGYRLDGGHTIEDLGVVMTLPASFDPEEPLPVVVFAHAVVTDRRFLLAVGGALAERGFATVAIDLPFHGERSVCVDSSLVSLPNFLPEAIQEQTGLDGQLLQLPPCLSGEDATCSPDGRCLDAEGNEEPLRPFLHGDDGTPRVVDMKVTSGAAFLDLNNLPHMRDHFLQSLVDLGALTRSLRSGAWDEALGIDLDTENLLMAGQSLGGILASVYSSVDEEIVRTVWNVPGGDMVNLFQDSIYFSPQVDAFFEREAMEPGTWEHRRLISIAHWLIDTVDPQSVAHVWRDSDRQALLQMGVGDFVMPNTSTAAIERVSGVPLISYPSPLHGDLVIPLIGAGSAMLDDMAEFLLTGVRPDLDE